MMTTVPATWNQAVAEVVKELIEYDFRPATLPELREEYDRSFATTPSPEHADYCWSMFGAKSRASAVTLAGQSLLWRTVIDTVIAKQRDYGKENILRFGQHGLEVRVHDKLARLEHLAATQATPKNESVFDTVLDLVGYSIIGVLLARGWFSLPLV